MARRQGQPIRVATGGSHGERKALVDQQRAAPLASKDTPGPGSTPAPPPALSAIPDGGIFGPSERPDEPLTAGMDFGPGAGAPPPDVLPQDPDFRLRAALAVSGSPVLARLLSRVAR
jgi:hypothetical protein